MTEILHTIIDVLAGRRNLPASEADAMHEALTPGYTIPAPSAADVAAAQALLAHAQAVAAGPTVGATPGITVTSATPGITITSGSETVTPEGSAS